MTPMFAQLQRMIVIPALGVLGRCSNSAVNLVLGTAAQESGAQLIAQWPTGPALGYWQIEPATHDDVWAHFLPYQPDLNRRVTSLLVPDTDKRPQLASNLLYGAAMCRLIYLRAPQSLPAANDIAGLAAYWKQYYNTPQGAGDPAEFVENYRRFIGG